MRAGIIVFDPHHSLISKLVRSTLRMHCPDRFLLIDPQLQKGASLIINPLDVSIADPEAADKLAQSISEALVAALDKQSMSENMKAILHPILCSLLLAWEKQLSDILKFVRDDPALIALGQSSPIPSHREFFRYFAWNAMLNATKEAIYKRISRLLNYAVFNRCVAGKSSINLERAINDGMIILISVGSARMGGKDAAATFGKLILSMISSIKANANKKVDTYLFIDEAHLYFSDTLSEMLTEQRKAGTYLILANQVFWHHLSTEQQKILLSNTFLKIAWSNDREGLGRFYESFGEHKKLLLDLPPFEFLMKTGGNTPLSLNTKAALVMKGPSYQITTDHLRALNEKMIEKYYRNTSYDWGNNKRHEMSEVSEISVLYPL